MANTDASYGMKPVAGGIEHDCAGKRYYVPSSDSTALFIGDPVKLAGSADSNGVPSVTRAGTSGNILGAIVAVENVTADSTTYRAASTERYVYVSDGVGQRYSIQADGTIAATDVSNTADLIFTNSGNTVWGQSGAELDTSDIGTGTQLRIVEVLQDIENEVGANAQVIVEIAVHDRAATKAGV